jgi:tRNA1Val (adenine37-N6)-methyltransferase
MSVHIFHFKQFSLSDDKSLMKIGTDAVLLGAWTLFDSKLNDTSNSKQILDIGTGCGIIAFMLAHNTSYHIDAVEIDKSSAEQAIENVMLCGKTNQIKIHNESLNDFIKNNNSLYDLVLSNPPFFSNSLKSPDIERNKWRHDDMLTYENLITGVKKILKPEGFLYLIIPYSELERFYKIALYESLYIVTKLIIKPKSDKAPNRVILKSGLQHIKTVDNTLTIRNVDNSYTSEYINLTKEFYVNF